MYTILISAISLQSVLLVKKKVYLNKSTDLNLVLTNYIICGCIKYSVLQREIKFKNLALLSLFTYRDNIHTLTANIKFLCTSLETGRKATICEPFVFACFTASANTFYIY